MIPLSPVGRRLLERPGLRLPWRRRTGPALDMVESIRRLLLVLVVVSLAVVMPLPLTAAHGGLLAPVLLAAGALVASWTYGYRRRTAPLATDLLDAVALGVLAAVCADPTALLTAVFPLVWFRSLYGSTGRAYGRCALLIATLVAAAFAGPYFGLHPSLGPPAPALGAFPCLLITARVSRRLAQILAAREQSGARDTVVATLGARLLGVTERAQIRVLAWEAVTSLCAATPGLRVLEVSGSSAVLQVEASAGSFVSVPTGIRRSVLSDPVQGPAAVRAELDAAAGQSCDWKAVTAADTDVASLLLGLPGGLGDEVAGSVTSVRILLALALRNSAVHAELSTQARLDGLTGLANRASFRTAVAEALRHHEQDPVTVLFIDLDDFKDVNDRLGHAAGDDVLRYVAGCLSKVTRGDDLCARLGGDEFAVLLRGADLTVAQTVAGRLVQAVAAPVSVNGGIAHVGASVGVAIAASAVGIEELVRQADVAMYAAKALGKGRVQTFEPGLLQIATTPATGRQQPRTMAAMDTELLPGPR